MRQIVDKTPQLGNFTPSRNGVGPKKADQQDQADWKSVQLPREGTYGLPGDERQSDGQRYQQNDHQQPEPAFVSR